MAKSWSESPFASSWLNYWFTIWQITWIITITFYAPVNIYYLYLFYYRKCRFFLAVCWKKSNLFYFALRRRQPSPWKTWWNIVVFLSPILCDAILPGVTCPKFNSHYIYMIMGCLGSEKLSYRLRWKVFRVKVSLSVYEWGGARSPLFNPDLIRKAGNMKYYECSGSSCSSILQYM